MAYLSKDDYSLRIGVSHLTEILEQAAETTALSQDNIRNNAESWAQATIKSYLTTKYNIDSEFALTGASRNFQILGITIDLSICTLHKTINPRDVPEHISLACEAAIKWLEEARNGTIVVDLPGRTNSEGGTNPARTFIGSQTKFISKPYSDGLVVGDTFGD